MFAYYIIFVVIVVVISCLDNSYFISATSSIEVDVDGNIVTDDDDNEKPTPSATKQSNIFSGIFGDGAPSILSTASVKNIDNLIKNIAKAIDSTSNAGYDEENSKKNDVLLSLEDILTAARSMAASNIKKERSIPQLIEHFKKHLQQSTSMLQSAFRHVDFSKLTLAAIWYYIEHVETIRTPSWKRRVHRYHKPIEIDAILELHDALYLMQIAYLPSDERIKNEVNKFRNSTYEVVYTETTGQPTEPAHFIMIPKSRRSNNTRRR